MDHELRSIYAVTGAVLFSLPAPLRIQLNSRNPYRPGLIRGILDLRLAECVTRSHMIQIIISSGEEISVGVRAYTHGYDLFHPNETILWHYYTKERAKHNYDHRDIAEELEQELSIDVIGSCLGMDPNLNNLEFGEYGFGTKRSLAAV